jgi:hypothetical protein
MMWVRMNSQKGYILPFVMMMSTLVLFLLSHQIAMYMSDMQFYKEKFELYNIERIIQKSIKEVENLFEEETVQYKEVLYDEGKASFQLASYSPSQKRIKIVAQTNNKRKSTIILYYDFIEHKIIRWIEGR